MGAIVVVLLLALALAALIMLYVAYPYRGEETPVAPLVGRAMRRGVESLPTVDPEPLTDERVSIGQPRSDAQVDAHR
jgi:hypothetical protein